MIERSSQQPVAPLLGLCAKRRGGQVADQNLYLIGKGACEQRSTNGGCFRRFLRAPPSPSGQGRPTPPAHQRPRPPSAPPYTPLSSPTHPLRSAPKSFLIFEGPHGNVLRDRGLFGQGRREGSSERSESDKIASIGSTSRRHGLLSLAAMQDL